MGQNQLGSVNKFTYIGAQINTQIKISDEIRKEHKLEIDIFMRIFFKIKISKFKHKKP